MSTMSRIPRTVVGGLLTVGLLGAAAHPEATLRSGRSSVSVGGTVPVEGAEFLPDQRVTLALHGLFNEYDVMDVQAGSDGTFSLGMEVPLGVRPGAYRLVAIADDGDVVASVDITVEAAGPAAAAQEAHDGMVHEEGGMGGMEARADDLPIERSRSGMEWGFVGLLIGLSAGLGMGLLRGSAS